MAISRPSEPAAHTPPIGGEQWHVLSDHLRTVAEQARKHADAFGAGDLAWWAGILHDAGKASPAFQDYLWNCATDPEHKHPTVDHKGAGVLRAATILEPLAVLIQGHHGGLPDRGELLTKFKDHQRRHEEISAALTRYDDLALPSVPAPDLPGWAIANQETFEFFLRMLFSALVDADHADTERHWNPERAGLRGDSPSIPLLWQQFERKQHEFAAGIARRPAAHSLINQVRADVFDACLAAADLPTGLFRLTVPTGGGKTRSALAFALKHASTHGLARIITAVPFLTITDQTAAVYRSIFPDEQIILEHHSGAGLTDDDAQGDAHPRAAWRQLVAQDWDAPLIVTTMVQLFESLLGRRTTTCRKLHRIAKSVIILDEAQTIPVHLRGPIFDVLRELVTNYGTTVVLCTATQPALDTIGDAVEPHEIAPNPPRLFRTLNRVRYEFPTRDASAWNWDRVAEMLLGQEQSLCVVNTIAQAQALFDAIGDDPAHFHLSTRMCGAHRRNVLAEVRRRLANGARCRLVSTQIIEAGVDIDFPLLLRALGPLDRIVQAAGRCNREGRLDEPGRVVVFEPAEGGIPAGAYRTGADYTRLLLREGELDLNDPDTFDRYFRLLYGSLPADGKHIQDERRKLNFETVANLFTLIDDDSAPVLVAYRGFGDGGGGRHAEIVAGLIREIDLATRQGNARWLRGLFQRAQAYVVNVRARQLRQFAAQGIAVEIADGFWRWDGGYDERRGLVDDRLNVETLFV